jgi:hypothetical protein
MVEGDDVLRLAVLEHCEGIAFQVGDDVLFVIDHRGVEHDLVDVLAKHKNALVGSLALIIFILGSGRGLFVAGRLALILRRRFLRPARYTSDAENQRKK